MSMMEESQYLMWMNRKQILKSQLQAAPAVGDGSKNYTWEERAFAEDAARVLGGSIWPPRSYSCSFCKREFRSAQALGGHMNVHRRDRARLKQNLSPHNEPLDLELDHHHHHKNDCNSLSTQLSSEISSSQLYCYLNPYSSPATTITTTRLSPSRVISTGENFGQQHTISPYNSSIIWGDHMGSPYSEPEGVVTLREGKFKGFDCDNYVETSLSVGLSSSMFGQKSPTVPCGDKSTISCKRLKKTDISSLPVFLKPCSNYRRLAFQSAEIVLGLNHPGMEDLDLELRLGKQQKVNLSGDV